MAEHGGQEARWVDAVREHLRRGRDRQQDEHRAPISLAGQRAEIPQSSGGDGTAQLVQLADQFGPQPDCLVRITAHRPQQQRTAAVGEGSMLSSRGRVVCLDREREDLLRHRGAQHPALGGEIRHLPGLRLIQFVAPHFRSPRFRLGDLPACGPGLPVLAQPVELHVPL